MSFPRRQYLEVQLGTRVLVWRDLLGPRPTTWRRFVRFCEELFRP